MEDHTAIQEAASAGLKSMEHLIFALSNSHIPSQTHSELSQIDYRELADFTVSKFKRVISILNRTGHARFRRSPSTPIQPKLKTTTTLDLTKLHSIENKHNSTASLNTKKPGIHKSKEVFTLPSPVSSNTSSFTSSINGDDSVSNGNQALKPVVAPARVFSAGKPPLAPSSRKRCHELTLPGEKIAVKSSCCGQCHCSKSKRR